MRKEEFVGVVDSIIQSLRDNPNQFHVNINISTTGLKIESSGESTGIRATVYGGTGVSARAEGGKGDIVITRGIADQEFKERLGKLVESLEAIKLEVKKDKPDKNRMRNLLYGLKEYGPDIVGAILGKLLDLLIP